MTFEPHPATFFASPERATPAELEARAAEVQRDLGTQLALDLLDGSMLILDRHRQIVASGARVAEALGIDPARALVGLRPGEMLGCVHADEGPGGCGTSPACAGCGAVLAIRASQQTGEPAVEEFLLTMKRGGRLGSRELGVRAIPLKIGDSELTAFVFKDVSALRRRELLERVFLHDFANLLSALQGWACVAARGEEEKLRQALERIEVLSERMGEELARHRSLLDAEEGGLVVTPESVTPGEVLRRIHEPFAASSRLLVEVPSDDAPIVTDPALLVRVLANMAKNAVEASPKDEHARVFYSRREGRGPEFSVWNAGVIPPDVALRIFKRSFSTKGTGRGIGTYSMKLFGESYLGGRVAFTSTPESGTTFTIALPEGGPPGR